MRPIPARALLLVVAASIVAATSRPVVPTGAGASVVRIAVSVAPAAESAAIDAHVSTSPSVSPSANAPDLTVPAAVLEDLDSGQVLFAKAAHEQRPIASLTKIMSAIVVLERTSLADVVTVSSAAASESGAEIGLVAGERMTVRNLLYAMLLQSANDAAVALADHVAGSERAFVELMNARGSELGLADTFFTSATGLDDRGYSTAWDVAAMTREAYRDPAFATIVRTRFRTIPSSTGTDQLVQNRNVLLFRYAGAIGVKTGLTTAAGHCLVAAADRDGVRLLAVALGHPTLSFDDGAALLNYGYESFRSSLVATKGEVLGTLDVGDQAVPAVVGADLRWLLPISGSPDIERELRESSVLGRPVRPGDPVGELIVRVDGRRIGSVPVVAGEPARSPTSPPIPPPEPGHPISFATAAELLSRLLRDLAGAFL